jgi:uncharacterized membrane protein
MLNQVASRFSRFFSNTAEESGKQQLQQYIETRALTAMVTVRMHYLPVCTMQYFIKKSLRGFSVPVIHYRSIM